MNDLFAVDVSSGRLDGRSYVLRTIPDDVSDRIDAAQDALQQTESLADPPAFLRALTLLMLPVGGYGAICLLCIFVSLLNGLPFAQAYANAPWVILSGAPCLAAAIAVWLTAFIRKRVILRSSAYAAAYDAAKEAYDLAAEEGFCALNVPETAVETDVLIFPYRTVNGKKRAVFGRTARANLSSRVFCEGEDICFTVNGSVVAVPKYKFGQPFPVKERLTVLGWNKPVSPRKGIYKRYKFGETPAGLIMKGCVCFPFEDGTFGIVVPPYEEETVLGLLGRIPA